MWIDIHDATRVPEQGKIYWITYVFCNEPRVVLAQYSRRRWYFINDTGVATQETIGRVRGWWSETIEKPVCMAVEMCKPYIVFPECEISVSGNNAKLKANLLSDEKMVESGFRWIGAIGKWVFNKVILPRQGISFTVSIPKEHSENFRIDVLDDLFGQPYDYQGILSKPTYDEPNRVAVKCYQEVEKYMERLQKAGIIEGHVKGEYI